MATPTGVPESALLAALLVAGWDETTAPLIVAQAAARKAANRKFVHGLYLNAADADVLTQKIAAIKEQVAKKVLLADTAVTQLRTLGLAPEPAAAIVADAAATAGAYRVI